MPWATSVVMSSGGCGPSTARTAAAGRRQVAPAAPVEFVRVDGWRVERSLVKVRRSVRPCAGVEARCLVRGRQRPTSRREPLTPTIIGSAGFLVTTSCLIAPRVTVRSLRRSCAPVLAFWLDPDATVKAPRADVTPFVLSVHAERQRDMTGEACVVELCLAAQLRLVRVARPARGDRAVSTETVRSLAGSMPGISRPDHVAACRRVLLNRYRQGLRATVMQGRQWGTCQIRRARASGRICALIRRGGHQSALLVIPFHSIGEPRQMSGPKVRTVRSDLGPR